MIVRLLNKKDVSSIVFLHLSAFKNFFLSELGESFLTTYYKAFVGSDRGLVLGCFDEDGCLIGFSATAFSSSGFNLKLISYNLFSFTIEGIKLLFTKPRSLVRLYKNLSKTDDGHCDKELYAELFSICTAPSNQGKGCGSLLLAETERCLIERDINTISLTTDKFENEKAISFYTSQKYEVMYEFTAFPSRKMYRLIKHLDII